MSAAHGKPHELTDEEKEFQEKYTDPTLVQDEQNFGSILSFVLALQTQGLSLSAQRFAAYKAVNDPDLSSKLLNLESSKEFKEIRSQISKARDVFDTATLNKKTGVRKSQTDTTRFVFSKTSININSLNKARAQVMVGERFHKLINSHEQNTRIDQATGLYGIKDREGFSKKIGEWMKQNPGKDFNDALHIVARQQYTLEMVGKEDGKLSGVDNKKLKDAKKQLLSKEKFEEARIKSITYGKLIQKDARTLLEKIKASEKGLDPLELKREIAEIGKEKETVVKIEPEISAPISTPLRTDALMTAQTVPHVEMDNLYDQMMGATNTVVVGGEATLTGGVRAVTNPPVPTASQVAPIAKPHIPTTRLGQAFGKISELFNKINPSSILQKGAANLLGRIGLGAGAKAGIAAALGVGTAGASLALQAGLALANKVLHLDKIMAVSVKAFLIFFIAILTAPVLLTLLAVSDQASLFGPLGTNPGQSWVFTNPKKIYSWNEFEKIYLTQSKKSSTLTWNEFNEKYLTPDSFLSLNTNGHNDVEK